MGSVGTLFGRKSLRSYIDNGALMGTVADYYKVGKAAARIVDRHQKGENLQEIPI